MRGEIKHIDRYKQLISYGGMELMRRITPTDIDGFIDLNGKCFIYIEGKLINKTMDYGQRLALENVVKSHEKANHMSCAIIFRHNTKADEIIDAKNQSVDEVYLRGKNDIFKWRKIKNTKLLEFLNNYMEYVKENNVKI